MNKYCSDCIHLNTNEEKIEGIYKCMVKIKEKQENVYTNACCSACEKFENVIIEIAMKSNSFMIWVKM
ncbi:MAG: hypothetical protein HFJ02_05910 [Bacilli bacterium]|nr:hypothetical protein [Bacilli bacterium]